MENGKEKSFFFFSADFLLFSSPDEVAAVVTVAAVSPRAFAAVSSDRGTVLGAQQPSHRI